MTTPGVPDDPEATRKAPPPAPSALDRTVLAPSGSRGGDESSLADTEPGLPGRRPGVPATRTFGRYHLVDEIARGGMGVVFRARQTDAQRDVALKVLLAGDFASEEDERRFVREAELAAQLNHPNIVAVYDVGREEGRRFFTMEIVEGQPFDRWAKTRGLEERLRALVKVCRAVHHAHMRGVIHRDLKPGNVLVTAEGEPKILDFGLAKTTHSGDSTVKTVTGQTLGTPFYMAPEQAAGRAHEVDIRSDVWALGVMLHETVCGQRPFQGTDLLEVMKKVETDDPARMEGPEELRAVSLKAMEKERGRRYATAEALAEDIERHLAGEPVSVRPPGVARRMRSWARRNPAAAGAVLALVAATAAAAGWERTRPGVLVFEVGTPGASVEVDGKPGGGEARVSAGRHTVVARAPGCEDWAAEISVERGERRTIPVALARSTGLLDLDADFPGTTVEIAGQVHGLPLRRHAVPTGEVRLAFRRTGAESRERVVRVERNAVSTAWVSLPPAGYAAQRIGNVFFGPCTTRDTNGDGTPDVAGHFASLLLTVDGRTAETLRATPAWREMSNLAWCPVDWDGDRVLDDAILGYFPGELRVAVWSGRDPGEAGTWRGWAPQKLLWEWKTPASTEAPLWPRPSAVGRDLWIPVPGGVRRARSGSAEPGPLVPAGGAPAPMVSAFGAGGILVTGSESVKALDEEGRVRWSWNAGTAVRIPNDGLWPHALPDDSPVPCATDSDLVGLDPADGRVAWRVTGARPGTLTLTRSAAGVATLYAFVPDGVAAFDVATGRRISRSPGPMPDGPAASCAWSPTAWCSTEGNDIVCRSAESGLPLWRFDTRTGTAAYPDCAEGPAGPEFAFVTRDHRFLVIGEDGRLRREVLLDFAPQQVRALSLDADGRPDWALLGYGVQVVRSTRVLWKRPSDNAVRSRPMTYRRNGEAVVTQVLRSGDDVSELLCLRGATGEVLWRYGTSFDVMHPPALADWNGDGTADVFTQTGNREKLFVCVDGRTGAELASTPLAGTPYPPALLRDLDGDGRAEAVIFEYPVTVRAIRPGKTGDLWTAESPLCVFQPPCFTDLTGDGTPAIVAAGASPDAQTGMVLAWDLQGHPLWSAKPGDRTWGPAFPHDLDGDGRAEIAVSCASDLVFLDRDGLLIRRLPGLGGSSAAGVALPDGGFVIGTRTGVARLRRDGSTAWTWSAGAPVSGAVGVADLPGGSAVVGADNAGRVFRLDLDSGRERWRFQLPRSCEMGVTLDDLDGDGVPEALLGCDDFNLYAIDLR